MDTEAKVRENRLRRMAERQSLTLTRSRRRDKLATNYGMYWLTRADGSQVTPAWRGTTLDEIERYLTATAAMKRPPAAVWQEFRDRVAELGGTVIEPEWLGTRKAHRVVCKFGHESTPSTASVLAGAQDMLGCAPARTRKPPGRRFGSGLPNSAVPSWKATGSDIELRIA